MNRQLKTWIGTFGDKWSKRCNGNTLDMAARRKTFKALFTNLAIPKNSVFEVGCNSGHNLQEIRKLGYSVFGCEPNMKACKLSQSSGIQTYMADGANLQHIKDSTFGIVFTSCVLIHTTPKECRKIMKEMARISKKYVLFIEYFAKKETKKVYRRHKELFFKRNFTKIFAEECKDFKLLKNGELNKEDGFDRTEYALFQRKKVV